MNRFVIMAACVGLCLTAGAQQATQTLAVAQSWANSTKVRGDLGYRYEDIEEQGKAGQQRDRIRARLGAVSQVAEDFKAELQLSTGGENPVSAYQTLGDASGRKDFRLSLAHIEWSPVAGAALAGGKMRNPFDDPGNLVWDADVTPEGLAMQASRDAGPLSLQATTGYLWLQERSAQDEAQLYAVQAGARYQFNKTTSMSLGGSFYGFDGMEGYDVIDWQDKSTAYGNSTVAGTVAGATTNRAYATGFQVVNGFGDLDFRLGLPVNIFGQWVMNTDAEDLDRGYAAGVVLGKAKNPRSAEGGYVYRRLEKDATVGFLTDSETWGGGTDGEGHKLYVRYQAARNVQCGVNCYRSEKPIADDAKKHDYERLQFDVGVTF